MKLHYLVVALLATRVSATCMFGYGCDSGSASVQNADISVTNSGYSATQTKGNSNNSNNNNNNGYANKHGNNYILTAQITGYTTVTVDGGTSGISAFPATTWNGPHLKTTTVSTAGPTNSNGNENDSSSNNGGNNGTGINQGTMNTGAIAGGVVGGFALASIIGGGIFFFVTRRERRRRDQGNLAINISENDFPSSPDTMIGSNTTPSSYNPPLRYDTPRRLVPQTNPHPPPIEYHQGVPAQNDAYAPPYQAEFGQGFEKPSEDTSHAGMWKPDVAESKPNV